MKITKHKHALGWIVHVNGRPTTLIISKGERPRYREPQMYDLTVGEHEDYLFEAPGVGQIMSRLERIASEFGCE